MIKICFIGNLAATYVRGDYKILKKYFDVEIVEPPKSKSEWLKYPSLIKRKVKNCDVVFGWFAGWDTAVGTHYAKKYGKKSIVVVGGHDAAYAPEINYGAFTNIKERLPAKYVLKNADLLLPVSEFTKNEVLKRFELNELNDMRVVYNGVDVEKFRPVPGRKENIVVTIGRVTNAWIKLKGLVTFAKASLSFPSYKFVIIGKTENSVVERLRKINSELIFTNHLCHDDVLKWLQRSKVYCQLSYMESFGMGVAEAMGCGCVPVVTDRGALPEVVGDCGFYVSYRDAIATTNAIVKALEAPEELGKKARERIKTFSIEKREKELIRIMESKSLAEIQEELIKIKEKLDNDPEFRQRVVELAEQYQKKHSILTAEDLYCIIETKKQEAKIKCPR